MHYFRYKNNELYCENVKVTDIVRRYGSPCYVYSYRTLLEHFKKLQDAFREIDPLICYSVKANSNLAILKALVNEGAGLDVVSAGELYRALKVKVDPKKIVFAGVGKTSSEIEYAIRAGILFFNVESEQELELIHEIAIRLRKTVEVCLRINPEVDPHTHHYIKTAKKESKFGLSFAAARHILLNRNRFFNINIKGLHIHIGSQITEARPYIQAIKKVREFIKEMSKIDVNFGYFNIGGGLGIIYNKETTQTAKIFAKAIIPLLKNTKLRIILEPGRFIAGSAGILATKVTYIKNTENKNFIIVDAGMSDLIRPALYEAYHDIVPIRKKSKVRHLEYDIVGPICESGDFFAKDRIMAQVEPGDLLAIMCAGAYGFSMSSNYNSRLRIGEVLVKDNRFLLIRKRETRLDLVKKEKIPMFLRKYV